MQEQRFLLITAVLIALVGAPAVYSILHEPENFVKSAQTQENVLDSEDAQRAPASVNVDTRVHANKIKSKSVILDYACKKNHQVYEVDGTLLRLKGNSCLDEHWKDVSIVNQTNGFTGAIIFLKNKSFTTDFIDLKEGDNNLTIQATDENGRRIVQNLTVKRRFPASAELSDD